MKFKVKFLPLLLPCFLLNIASLYAEVRVGTVFFKPPFVMSLHEGFDVELIRSLCQRIKENCLLVQMDFHKLFSALNEGTIDIAIAGINISQTRQKNYIFSLPYILTKAQFLTLKSSAFKSKTDLKGKNIGIIRGEEAGAFASYLNEIYKNQIQIVQFNNMENLVSALNQGSIAAALLHKSTAEYWVVNSSDQFKLLDHALPRNNALGIIALPKNLTLIQRLNGELERMEEDGSYLKLYNAYFF